jgi:hypothetical protein
LSLSSPVLTFIKRSGEFLKTIKASARSQSTGGFSLILQNHRSFLHRVIFQ